MESRTWPHRLGIMAAALWIALGTLYFYVHFTLVFYRANQRAIDGVLTQVREWLP